jgi:enoyl-CoA hydratase/carnithine racemase
MKDRVSLAIERGIATLTLDRPEQGDTIDLPMAYALRAARHQELKESRRRRSPS